MADVAAPGGGVYAKSLAEQAYYAIRELIVSVAIAPGAPIQEDRLCEELGLGRTPVREAIKRLEAERLVVIYRAAARSRARSTSPITPSWPTSGASWRGSRRRAPPNAPRRRTGRSSASSSAASTTRGPTPRS